MLEVLLWVVQVLHVREEAVTELSKHIQEAQRLQKESEADKVLPYHVSDPSCVSTVTCNKITLKAAAADVAAAYRCHFSAKCLK